MVRTLVALLPSTGRTRLLMGAAAVLAMAAVATPALASNAAQKVNFREFPFATCLGAIGGTPDDSFAVIKRNGDSTVSAEVALKGAQPNATYAVDLVQSGCSSQDFTTLTTNGQGNGNAHISAPQTSNDASVFIYTVAGPFDFQQTPEVTFP